MSEHSPVGFLKGSSSKFWQVITFPRATATTISYHLNKVMQQAFHSKWASAKITHLFLQSQIRCGFEHHFRWWVQKVSPKLGDVIWSDPVHHGSVLCGMDNPSEVHPVGVLRQSISLLVVGALVPPAAWWTHHSCFTSAEFKNKVDMYQQHTRWFHNHMRDSGIVTTDKCCPAQQQQKKNRGFQKSGINIWESWVIFHLPSLITELARTSHHRPMAWHIARPKNDGNKLYSESIRARCLGQWFMKRLPIPKGKVLFIKGLLTIIVPQ